MVMLMYICCYASSIFFAWLASRSKDKGGIVLFSVISILIPSILGGLRNVGVGTDTMVYGLPNAMEAQRAASFAEFVKGKEPGYAMVCYFTMKFFGHVNWCFFMYQLITVGCFYIGAYKHRKVVSLPFLMFIFLTRQYLFSYNAMRQSMAAAIIFMGIDNLENKRYGIFMLYTLVAFTFHFSSLAVIALVLCVYLIINHKSYFRQIIPYILIILLFLTRPVSYALLQLIHFEKYYNYVLDPNTTNYAYNVNGRYLLYMLFQIWEVIIFLMYAKGGRKLLGRDNFEYYKFNLIISFMFYHVVRLMFRLAMYNEFINNIAVCALPRLMKDETIRKLVTVAIVLAYCMRWYRDVAPDIETWTYVAML